MIETNIQWGQIDVIFFEFSWFEEKKSFSCWNILSCRDWCIRNIRNKYSIQLIFQLLSILKYYGESVCCKTSPYTVCLLSNWKILETKKENKWNTPGSCNLFCKFILCKNIQLKFYELSISASLRTYKQFIDIFNEVNNNNENFNSIALFFVCVCARERWILEWTQNIMSWKIISKKPYKIVYTVLKHLLFINWVTVVYRFHWKCYFFSIWISFYFNAAHYKVFHKFTASSFVFFPVLCSAVLIVSSHSLILANFCTLLEATIDWKL